MRHLLLLSIGLLWANLLSAQMYFDDGRLIYGGDSTVQGSYQALGINPANLGRANSFRTSGGILQFGGNMHAEGLNLSQVLALSLSGRDFDSTLRNSILTQSQATGGPFTYDGNVDMVWGAFSVAGPRMGGLAINVQDRIASSAEIPTPFLGVLLEGDQADALQGATSLDSLRYIGDGSRATYSHIRALRIGYGREVMKIDSIFTLYAGATFQYLWGIGHYQAQILEGEFSSLGAFSDAYRVNYAQVNVQDPSDQRRILSNSGTGWAMDIGWSLDIGSKINVGLSLIDIGGITWDQNLVAAEASMDNIIDSLSESLINSYDLNQELGNVYDVVQERPGESFRTGLNTQMRLNGSYRLRPSFIVGADLVLPFRNGSLEVVDRDAGVLTATMSWSMIPRRLNVSSGFIYSPSFGYRWPVGVAIGFGKGAISITTSDMSTFLSDRDPLASLSVAFITGIH